MSATCDCRVGGSERAAYRAQRRSNKKVPEPDAQSNCGIDVVALKIAVSQSAIHFREHQPGVEIPLRGKLPIDNAGDRVKRTGALRVLAAGAGQRPRGGSAVVRILSVMVIGGDYVQLVGNGVSHACPHDLEDLVAETVAATRSSRSCGQA